MNYEILPEVFYFCHLLQTAHSSSTSRFGQHYREEVIYSLDNHMSNLPYHMRILQRDVTVSQAEPFHIIDRVVIYAFSM
jgi:hypothetical protein